MRSAAVLITVVIVGWPMYREVERYNAGRQSVSEYAPGSIEYLGHSIKLTRDYSTYEEYKEDPNKIDPSQLQLVEQLVSQAPVKSRYQNGDELTKRIFDITFPGYGFAGSGAQRQSNLSMFGVEIPRVGRSRYLVFREANGVYTLMDDFVASDDKQIWNVWAGNGELTYSTQSHDIVCKRPIVTR